jgi:phosphate-selective porin OprO and OprP
MSKKSVFFLLSLLCCFPAAALELYEDPVTNQVYTKPGPNRVKLGKFEKVDENIPAKVEQANNANKPQVTEGRDVPKPTGQLAAVQPKALEKPPTEGQMAGGVDQEKAEKPKAEKGILPAGVTYGKKGFEFKTEDGRFAIALQNRIQFRYATPFDRDPRSISQLEQDSSSFMIRRARTKISGHAFWPWLKYYFQYDWSQPVMRDLSLTVDKYKAAELWVGRGKVRYNNERVTSSGNQQFVNRSIVNDIFTVDRQQGVQLFGNLFPHTLGDFSYALGIFSGEGVGERLNDDDNMMWSGRLQWNPLGGEMKFSQSDTEYLVEPHLNVAFAANTNQSRCTAFETASDSCRALNGFNKPSEDNKSDNAGQYRVNQMLEEVHFKWRGFSLLHEMHWKSITDTFKQASEPGRKINMTGALVQAGYFPHYILPLVPKNLEFAARYAFVDPNTAIDHNDQQEASGVMNYFFDGHSNKLSFQVSHLMIDDPESGASQSEQRYWVQWDLTF